MSPFPFDLIPDILCRLPVKTLLRFKLDFDSLDNLVRFPRPFMAEITKYRSRIIRSCNGLLYHREQGIALWNPSTRKCRYLLPLDDDIARDHNALPGYEYVKNPVLGFGYDEIILKLIPARESTIALTIFRRTTMTAPTYNALHWVGDEIGEFHGGQVIFALDLANEKYYDVPEGDTSFKIKECGGECPYFGYMNAGSHGPNYFICLDSRDQWLTNIFHTRAVGFSKNVDKVLLDDGGGSQPAWFNLEDETGETLRIAGAPQLVSTVIYVESLVPV
ncbi:hypothetical protein F3Y22_tig00110206pilonHSYRG00344 [Hibiscus syriacus]|uniref:F-box domain-containing protein n=1 Tax=Hibiscus syriacus TaxID=106335 RepID=A0A6A3BB44_HIBSY|nr:hypothetical protein F3Y22_tig00110206pilonHSYRG00344 [Hibiscus syriacus]